MNITKYAFIALPVLLAGVIVCTAMAPKEKFNNSTSQQNIIVAETSVTVKNPISEEIFASAENSVSEEIFTTTANSVSAENSVSEEIFTTTVISTQAENSVSEEIFTTTVISTQAETPASDKGIILPIRSGVIRNTFGEDIPIPFYAIELLADKGDDVLAATSGKVVAVNRKGWAHGKNLAIERDDGISALYSYCNEILVKEGDYVKQGDVIARVGNSGRADCFSLRFEMAINGNAIPTGEYKNHISDFWSFPITECYSLNEGREEVLAGTMYDRCGNICDKNGNRIYRRHRIC